MVHVENLDGKVLVRATRNTFTETAKVHFIHALAAEAFIPDDYQTYSGGAEKAGVEWVIGAKAVEVPESVVLTARRAMVKMLIGSAILFGVLMTALFLGLL